MIASFRVRVLSAEYCGADILTVRVERPDGYSFRAGQWLRFTLPTSEGEQTRTLSHAASPNDDWLEVTTRLSSSAFKIALASVDPGAEVTVTAPGGRFALPETDSFAALVGGVGITPVRSMLRFAAQEGRRFADGLVLYGNRDDSCEPYRDEIEAMSGRGVRLVRVLERAGDEWDGERGFITPDVVRRYMDPGDGRPFLVSGPPVMVDVMADVLDALGVEDVRRHIEHFGPSASESASA